MSKQRQRQPNKRISGQPKRLTVHCGLCNTMLALGWVGQEGSMTMPEQCYRCGTSSHRAYDMVEGADGAAVKRNSYLDRKILRMWNGAYQWWKLTQNSEIIDIEDLLADGSQEVSRTIHFGEPTEATEPTETEAQVA